MRHRHGGNAAAVVSLDAEAGGGGATRDRPTAQLLAFRALLPTLRQLRGEPKFRFRNATKTRNSLNLETANHQNFQNQMK